MSQKRYLCISDYIISPYDGEKHLIPAHNLPKLYRVHSDTCFFVTAVQLEDPGFARGFETLIWLRPQTDGKYKIPEHSICKCGATMLWLVTAANKRIPVDCRYDIVGQKVFVPKIMTSHFATCPLVKEFIRKKETEIKEIRYGEGKS